MELSVSLPEDEVELLDAYAEAEGLSSRSATSHKAVLLLRGADLGAAYEDAFAAWESDGDADLWDATVGDGLTTDAQG